MKPRDPALHPLGQPCGLRSKVLYPLGLNFVAFVIWPNSVGYVLEPHTLGRGCGHVGEMHPRGLAPRRLPEASAPVYSGRRGLAAGRAEARREFPPGGLGLEKRHVLLPGPPSLRRGPAALSGNREREGAGTPQAAGTRELGGAGKVRGRGGGGRKWPDGVGAPKRRRVQAAAAGARQVLPGHLLQAGSLRTALSSPFF